MKIIIYNAPPELQDDTDASDEFDDCVAGIIKPFVDEHMREGEVLLYFDVFPMADCIMIMIEREEGQGMMTPPETQLIHDIAYALSGVLEKHTEGGVDIHFALQFH